VFWGRSFWYREVTILDITPYWVGALLAVAVLFYFIFFGRQDMSGLLEGWMESRLMGLVVFGSEMPSTRNKACTATTVMLRRNGYVFKFDRAWAT